MKIHFSRHVQNHLTHCSNPYHFDYITISSFPHIVLTPPFPNLIPKLQIPISLIFIFSLRIIQPFTDYVCFRDGYNNYIVIPQIKPLMTRLLAQVF
jgi:hypothetical protein